MQQTESRYLGMRVSGEAVGRHARWAELSPSMVSAGTQTRAACLQLAGRAQDPTVLCRYSDEVGFSPSGPRGLQGHCGGVSIAGEAWTASAEILCGGPERGRAPCLPISSLLAQLQQFPGCF